MKNLRKVLSLFLCLVLCLSLLPTGALAEDAVPMPDDTEQEYSDSVETAEEADPESAEQFPEPVGEIVLPEEEPADALSEEAESSESDCGEVLPLDSEVASEDVNTVGESPAEEDWNAAVPAEEVSLEPAAEESLLAENDVIASGTCGDSLVWSLDDQGKLTIAGSGPMEDYEFIYPRAPYSTSPWSSYISSIRTIEICEGVTSIGNAAFPANGLLTDVKIPGSVTWIGSRAFAFSPGLTSVTIPESVTGIGISAFDYCTGLTSITIPGSVNFIGEDAFHNCSGLTSLTIREGVTTIYGFAFSLCRSLTSVEIPDSVTTMGGAVFSSCSSLKKVTIPGSVTSTGGDNFAGCDELKTAGPIGSGCDIEFGWTEVIPEHAFGNCRKLTSVTIPGSVTTMGESVFSGCVELKTAGPIGSGCNIEFGWTEAIPDSAFCRHVSLTGVTIPDGAASIGAKAFYGCSSLTDVPIPESVTDIGVEAFSQCSSLVRLTIPKGVTAIGSFLFSECSSLTHVTIPERVTAIGTQAFYHCSSLSKVEIPEGVLSIGGQAFEGCSSLPEIVIPEGITRIAGNTFSGCSALTVVTIPESVTTVDYQAFAGCSPTDVYFGGSRVQWQQIRFVSENDPLQKAEIHYAKVLTAGTCGANLTWELNDSTKVLVIRGTGAMDQYFSETGSVFYTCREYIGELRIEAGVSSIGDYAFSQCSGLTYVTIPEGVTVIGKCAFLGCSGLADVEIPKGVTDIGEKAFSGCTGLTRVTIPASLVHVGTDAFLNCYSIADVFYGADEGRREHLFGDMLSGAAWHYTDLDGWSYCGDFVLWKYDAESRTLYLRGEGAMWRYREAYSEFLDGKWINHPAEPTPWAEYAGRSVAVKIQEGVTTLSNECFSEFSKVREISLPASIEKIGTRAFYNCVSLTTAALPTGLKKIEDSLFYGCSGLRLAVLPDTVTAIGKYAFSDCSALAEIGIPQNVAAIGDAAFSWCSNLQNVYFYGGCPDSISSGCFSGVRANAYYPDDGSWWKEDLLDYGGNLTWIAVTQSRVTYDANGGSGAPAAQDKVYGIPLILSSEVPSLESGVFLGWARTADAAEAGYLPGELFYGEGEVTLYAVWNRSIPIDTEHFPDENFRQLVSGFDRDSDGILNGDELRSVTVIRCDGRSIASLEGIGYFEKLQSLYCYNNQLTDLDLNGLAELEYLVCSSNRLTELDISPCTKLTKLYCETNQLTAIDLSKNRMLVSLTCYGNRIGELDLSSSEELVDLVRNGTRTPGINGTVGYRKGTSSNMVAFDADTKIQPLIFSDNGDPTAYFHDAVYWAADNGITSGTSPTTFSPNKECTRGQIVTFLWKSMGSPEPSSAENPFTDVKESDYFFKPVLWAKENGITSGKTATTFAPGAPCTRGQIVTFLWIAKGRPEPADPGNPFLDVSVNDYFYKPVLWAKENGITSGTSATGFSPGKTCTRAQAMTFLWNASGKP